MSVFGNLKKAIENLPKRHVGEDYNTNEVVAYFENVKACFGEVEQQLKDLLKNKPKRKAYTMNSYLDDEIDEFLEKLEKLLEGVEETGDTKK